MPVRNSYRPRRRFSRCDHQPQVKSTSPPSLTLGQHPPTVPVPFSSALCQPRLPYPRFCTAMRQSLIKFNNFCAARALPILRSRPSSPSSFSRFSRSSPPFALLLLYFSLSRCLSPSHRRVSAIYFPAVVSSSRYKLAPLAAEPLSTADL